MRLYWKLLGVKKPKPDPACRLHFVKALERLLLVSVSGALFFALVRNIPIHLQQVSTNPNLEYTLDLILRYLCVLWFLAYFFVSAVNNEQSNQPRKGKDIFFDLLQSVSVLTAMYALGFVYSDRGYGFDDGLIAFRLTFLVVMVICLSAILLFSSESELDSEAIDRVRMWGFRVAIVGVFLTYCLQQGVMSLLILLFLQLSLWLVWWGFFLLRRDTISAE